LNLAVIDTLISWLGGGTNTVAFAILTGVVGFLAKVFYDIWLARRKDKLERVNQQLKLLYGPLYSLDRANNLAWAAFRSRTRPEGSFFKADPPPNPEELEKWRRWMRTFFRPIHNEMLSLITKNADLLIGDDLPESFQLFCAHVAAYRVVFDQWSENDFSEQTSVIDYPTAEMAAYLRSSFTLLKSQQRRLLGMRSGPPR
jgi:hypothetical protein